MENYRNNSYFAQEGCPSLDFTLLDRPPSSVSAPGSTAPLFPGENPLSSFDFVDGAGVESYNDRSFPGHRSYMPEAAKDALRRNISMQPGPLQRQGLGEHYFFGQDNQQSYSRLGNGDGHVQSQNISLGGPNPEQLGAGSMPMEYTLGGKTQSSQSRMPSGNTGSLSPSIHAAHPSAGAYVDDRRNQVPSTQQYPSDSQNTSSKFSNFLPVNIGTLEHQSNAIDIASASGLYHQDHFRRYASQNIVGTTANETLNRTFPTNQLPNGSVPVAPEARPGGATRGFGMTELQLLRQQALQSKQQQALQFKQQQAMRLQQQEAMRAQHEEATRQQQKMQQEAAMMAQKQEVLRMQQQQEAMRLQQQEVMQSQQQEVFRMQQQSLYLQQQGAARTEEQNAVLWSQEQVGMPSKQQNTAPLEQQQAIWSQQQKTVWRQQESAEQRKSLQSQQQRAWLTQQQQTFPPYQQQASSSNQLQTLQFQKEQAFQGQQPHVFQNHQRLSGSQQQHSMRFQQQASQTQHQQAPQSQQKHVSSLQQLTLQSQQELFEASQQVLSQETCAEFQGTSYSALLHGPDTPPSHTQTGGETLFSDLESNTASFPPANTHTVMWPTYGSSSYQGLPREHSMGQNSVESQNLRHPLHTCDDYNFALAEGEGRQSTQSEYPFVGSSAASPVKPAFEFNKSGSGNGEVGGFGSIDNSTFDARSEHQVPAKPLLQTSQYLGGQSVRPNGLSNGPIQTNLLSQSQQHFQGLQLSQQRSWECLVQKHGVSKPSFPEIHPSLSQGISSIERGSLERGFQQNLSSIGTGRRSPGHDSQRLGNINPDTGYKQHQMFSSAVGEVARNNMDEEERQCPDLRSIITGRDARYHSRHDSDANSDTWGNRVAQLATPNVRVPVHSASPSDGMSQAMFNNNQGTHLNMQAPPKTTTVRNALSSQESIVWENDISRQTSSYFSKSDGYSQGFWKQHASFPESVCGLESTCAPPNRHTNDSTWKHNFQSYKSNFDAQFNTQATSLISVSPREQDNAGQPMHEKQLLGHEGVFQQVHNSFSVNGVGSQPITYPVEALSKGTATSNSGMGQIHKLNTSIGLQGSAVDKLRISELPMDPSSSRSVSLAHLRQSRPSSPLSPQHVKLGLGPANLPQNIQQVCNVSTPASSQIDGSYLKNHGCSSSMEGKKFLPGTPQDGSGHESPAGSRRDPNQGITASVNGVLLQNNARPLSALSNSSSFSKESADSESLPPTSNTPGVEGSDFSRGITSLTGNAFHGVGTNVGYFEEESSSTLHGELKPPADNYSQPPHSDGSSSQGKFSTGPCHENMDAGSLRVLQNQQIINMALKQLGNKTQGANLAGLLTTLKTSLSEHSINSGDDEKLLPGRGESDCLASGNAQEDGNAPSLMQSPQMIWRKPPGPVLEDCSRHLKAASLSVSNEYNQNCRFKQEEGSGSAITGLLSDLQRQSRESLYINGSKSHAGEQGARLSVFRTLNPVSSQVEVHVRDSNTQPETFGQDQYLQQQNFRIESLLLHQASKGATVDTVQAARFPNTADADDKLTEAQLKPFKSPSIHGYLGKVAFGHGDGTFVDTAMELEKAQQQTASSSEFVSQSSLHSVDNLPSRHGQLSKQIAIGAVIASSSQCTGTVVDVGLANDAQPSHNLRLPSDLSNDQVLHSQKPKQENFNAEYCPQFFLANQSTQRAAHINHLPNRQDDTDDVKVEDARLGVNGHIATLNRLPPRQISPSKTSLPGPSAIQPKKRKKPVPLLIPWYIAATQPRDSLPSTSEMELMWANTANRLSDKDDGDARKENVSSSIKARRRLRLTTQLLQQLIPPLPAGLMHGNTLVDNECATFSLAKFALEDACRLVTNTRREASSAHDCSENKNMPLRGQQRRTWGMAKSVAVTRCVESFMERARGLESELARIETSSSVSDVHRDIGDSEKLAIVNRLAKHHGTSFTVDSSELCSIETISDVTAGIWKPSPKKYVTATPMPRTLPGVKCLSL